MLAFMRLRTVAALEIVDRHLAGCPFIAGERLTIADLSMVGYVDYPSKELGFDQRAEYPHIGAWMERVARTPGWSPPYELLA